MNRSTVAGLLAGALLVLVAACGASDAGGGSASLGAGPVPSSAPVVVPDPPPSSAAASVSTTSSTPAPPITGRPATTMPPPSPAIPPGPATVYVLGDSVILGAQADVPAALPGWNVTFDAIESRFIFKGLDELQAKVAAVRAKHDADQAAAEQEARDAARPLPPAPAQPTVADVLGRVAVIHLCTNYEATGAFAGWIDKYMTYLQPLDRVVWVTCVEWSKGQVEANRAMHDAAARYPTMVVADWAPAARTPGYAYNDGIHLQAAGRKALADVVARAVGPAPGPAPSSTTTRVR